IKIIWRCIYYFFSILAYFDGFLFCCICFLFIASVFDRVASNFCLFHLFSIALHLIFVYCICFRSRCIYFSFIASVFNRVASNFCLLHLFSIALHPFFVYCICFRSHCIRFSFIASVFDRVASVFRLLHLFSTALHPVHTASLLISTPTKYRLHNLFAFATIVISPFRWCNIWNHYVHCSGVYYFL